jgi:hypothetical protein
MDDRGRLSAEQERGLKAALLGAIVGLVLAILARRRA